MLAKLQRLRTYILLSLRLYTTSSGRRALVIGYAFSCTLAILNAACRRRRATWRLAAMLILLSPLQVRAVLRHNQAMTRPVRREAAKSEPYFIDDSQLHWRNPYWSAHLPKDAKRISSRGMWDPTINADGYSDQFYLDTSAETHHLTHPEEPADFLVVPTARYHITEMRSITSALSDLGLRSEIALLPNASPGMRAELSRHGAQSRDLDLENLPTVAGVLVLNDWGSERVYLEAFRKRGSKIFAKVEGAQDFSNVDTLRWTIPYTYSDTVFLQGRHDEINIKADNAVVVGSGRIEDLIALRSSGMDEAVIRASVVNLNFAYGTFAWAAGRWMEKVRMAHAAASVPLFVSVHPAIDAELEGRSPWPLALDLETSNTLVTRCSTALFDALALGRRVAYFNPHNEKVWKDVTWTDSVPLVADTSHLSQLLVMSATSESSSDGLKFLTDNFISIDSERSSAQRTAKAIVDELGA